MKSREDILELADPVQRERVKAMPRLRRFLDEVRAALSKGGSFLDDCEVPFTALVRDRDFVPDLLAHEMAKLKADPGYSIPRASERALPLAHFEHGRLGLRLLEPSGGAPSAPSRMTGLLRSLFVGVCGPGGASIERFAEESPGRPLRRVGVERLEPGDVRKCVTGGDVIHSWAGDMPSVWLTFVEAKEAPTCWVYDYATLAPVRQQAASDETTRLEYVARLLCELGYTPAGDAIAGLYEHPDHYIRWGALRQLARLDQDRALSLLRVARNDPHPHVRNAATAALARYDGEVG